jgi:magnesium-transporting ATPase (P-type)
MSEFIIEVRNKISKTSITWQVSDKSLEKSETLNFNHSQHSLERSNQRNIPTYKIAQAIEYGTAYFKQGLIFYVLGVKSIPDYITKKSRNNNSNLIVVVAGDSNTILTCYRSKNPFKHIKKKQKNIANIYTYC